MKKKIVDFGTCEAPTEKELEKLMEEYSRDGWVAHGYPVCQESMYVQIMVKYNFPEVD